MIGTMFLTITTEPPPGATWPATDLGYLLHKNPERVQSFGISYGTAHVFYPEASPQRCTAALLLEIDPIGLVRGKGRNATGFALAQYVNDRPYAASSLLASALGQVFRTALRGRCEARPELAAGPIPLRIQVPALACAEAASMFEPLGWEVEARQVALDPTFPEWGDSRYARLTLTGTVRLADALSHLYVLLAALDGSKHYWVGSDEVDKLVRAGEGWLGAHPLRETIARRYLARRQSLVQETLARLAEVDEVAPEDNPEDDNPARQRPLAAARRQAVLAALREVGAARVLDLGCGDGALIQDLIKDTSFTEIVGVDVSAGALKHASRKLGVERLPERVAARLTLRQGSLTYTDSRLAGYDAAVLMEVIEHIDPSRLGALEHTVFAAARPQAVIVTTPNSEYNIRFEGLKDNGRRHHDHRFEWTRAEFRAWAERVAAAHGYDTSVRPVGEPDPDLGSPTQLALFTRRNADA
jgi:3' terminal RNA ribose 2'-O-methyltransferase Hen1